MSDTTNQPAFPGYGDPGMTLRDYFAAKAMQSTLADDAYIEKTQTPAEWLEIVAKASYEIADAMIKAREAK